MLKHSHSQTSVELQSQNLVKLHTRQAYLLQHSHSHTSVELESKNLVKIYTRQSLHATTQSLPDFRQLESQHIWSNYTTRQAYLLQHSHSHTSVDLESQNLVKIYTRQSLHTTTQLLPHFSRARIKIWSNYIQD